MTEPISEKTASKSSATTGAESPTTAREPDFDDDLHESSAAEALPSPAHKKVSFQEQTVEAPPPKPPRPVSAQAQAEITLYDAFPSVDPKVVKAVLVASGYKVEPAFNALLSMSDPDYVAEEYPPAPPPRHAQEQRTRSQLESDELYARQLAEHYSSPTGFGARGGYVEPQLPRRRQEGSLKPNELNDDRDRSFFDDDLPVIKQNIQKGFAETQTKVNKWITDFRKKLDGDEDDEPLVAQSSSQAPLRQNFGPSQTEQLRGIRRSAEQGRRSGDRERYDADPRVLSDDFTQLELHDSEGGSQRRGNRPLANPDLFKPTPISPPQSGPVDEVEALHSNPLLAHRQPSPSTGKPGKKWQPLTSVAPNPESEDHDPFSLGDSDEEENRKTDLKPEATERLKRSATSTEVPDEQKGGTAVLQEAEQVGTKNKVAEELLKDQT